MLQSWIREFKQSLSATITGYLLQAVAAITFLVALGFATAAIVIWLKTMMSDTLAYLVVATGFAVVGLIVMAIGKSMEEKPAETAAHSAASDEAAQGSLLASLGTVAGLVVAHPGMAFSALKIVIRNIPALIAGLALGGLLFSDSRARAAAVSNNLDSSAPRS